MGSRDITMQEAARKILEEEGFPLSTKKLAQIALEKRYVTSSASHPERSLANTLDQNIQKEKEPRLTTFEGAGGESLVGLPEWKEKVNDGARWWEEVKIRVSVELFKKLQLAQHARIGPDLNQTIICLLESGFQKEKERIKEIINEQLNEL